MELLHKSDTGSLCPFYANLNFSATGKLSILTDNSGTYATFASASNVNDGNWKTVVVSGGGGVGEMMINGTVDATTATLARSIVSSSTRDFQFMRRWDGAYSFNGMCGPVYFWNSKLTTEQKRLVTQYIESGRYPYAFRRSIPANIRSKLRLHYAGYQSGTTVYDMSGNGNNGTSVGSPTIARSQQNTCLLFNGSSQYVNGPTFDTGNDFAVSCWFKPTTTASEQVFFANAQGSGSSLQGFFFLYDPSNKLRLTEYMPSFSNRDLYTGTLTLTANKWYLCTCVIRGGTVYEIYLNDHLEAKQTGTDKTSYNQASRFGSYSHTTASYITGPSECFVWNTAPSQQEIQQLYYATHRN
jgi:hypothetical protein